MYKIKIGEGSCGISAGAGKIHKLLDEKSNGNYTVHTVGCIGMCFLEPIVDIYDGDTLIARLVKVSPDDIDKIISFTESGDISQINSLVISNDDRSFLDQSGFCNQHSTVIIGVVMPWNLHMIFFHNINKVRISCLHK